MEPSDLNSMNDVETDRASLNFPTEEVTCDGKRLFAGHKQEHAIFYPPQFKDDKPFCSVGQTGECLYQCSRNRHGSGSGSDSAEEEQSPFSSTEKLKYEAFAPTGNRQDTDMLRKERIRPPQLNKISENDHKMSSSFLRINTVPHTEEIGLRDTTEALAHTGRPVSHANLVPRGEIETSRDFDVNNQKVTQSAYISKYEDVDARLVTFLGHVIDWPHKSPSAEQMAKSGMIYKGVFTVKGKEIYDMVECYKCRNTMYGFTENDDPSKEHRKYYPNCI